MARVTLDGLTAVAADLADQVGFENVTVSALARHFGVRGASLYSHIRNLAELRSLVAAQAIGELADQVALAVAGRSGRSALVAFAHAHRDYARQYPGRYAATQLELDEPAAPVAAAARRYSDLSRVVLRGYRLPEPDQTDALRMLGATLHGYVTLEASGGFRHHPRPTEASWERTLDALDAVLGAWPG